MFKLVNCFVFIFLSEQMMKSKIKEKTNLFTGGCSCFNLRTIIVLITVEHASG